jgi:trans-aconitate methyltransferase
MEVLDICCGDCYITHFLKGNKYLGYEIIPAFVKEATKKGLNVELVDIKSKSFPETECILISRALYQLYPNHEEVIIKALNSAKKKLIIAESAINLASSGNPIVSSIAKRSTNPGVHSSNKRFNLDELRELYEKYGADKIEFLGRDLIGVFKK